MASEELTGALDDLARKLRAERDYAAEMVAAAYEFGVQRSEAVVREQIALTKWASDARSLRLAADAIHGLLIERV